MATSTTNLGLTKPSVNDAADIAVLNSNFDKIDALGGYGLGAFSTDSASLPDANTAIKSGWYRLSSSTANGIGSNCVIRVDSYGSNYCTQTAYLLSLQHNTFIQRQCVNGTWTVWEWENPPMVLGVEYRTTKRCEGKPVYAKRISLGTLPNNSEKTVSYEIIGYTPVSHEETFVSTSGWKLCTYPNIVVIPNGDGYCTVKTTEDFSMYTGYTTLEYVYN